MTPEQTNETIRDLWAALEESVKLQSHYAELLNMHDGGERRGFQDAQAWMDRLIEIGKLRPAPAEPGGLELPRGLEFLGRTVRNDNLSFDKLTLTTARGDLYEFNLRSIGVQASITLNRTR